MKRLSDNKIVLVTRATRLAELTARFNTVAQAQFYVEHLGADFSDYQLEDQIYRQALHETVSVMEQMGRLQVVDRSFLPNFLFGPGDYVVTLGQDGLVANTLKYLDGQPLVGINPDPGRWDGKLLPFEVNDLPDIIPEVFSGRRPLNSVTMAKATLNDGQEIYAVNDLFLGPKSHTSARYSISMGSRYENHSSSGVIVSTGLGSSGWLRSIITGAAAITQAASHFGVGMEQPSDSRGWRPFGMAPQPSEFPWDAKYLSFTVREPFPSQTTGAEIVCGRIEAGEALTLTSQMAENGVIFSDGIEKDYLEFNSGAKAVITVAERQGNLVV